MDISKNFMALMKNWGYENEESFFKQLEDFELDYKRLLSVESDLQDKRQEAKEMLRARRQEDVIYRTSFFKVEKENIDLRSDVDFWKNKYLQLAKQRWEALRELNIDE